MQHRNDDSSTTGASEPACDEVLRCACGSLLARYVRGGIELKCRRCKRTIVIALSDIAGSPSDVQ